jgi:hypothetical protein
MKIEMPEKEFETVATPFLERVAAALGRALLKAAQALAEHLTNGYMDKPQAAAYLGIEVRALENWMLPVEHPSKVGRGLPYAQISQTTVRFRRQWIDAWMWTLVKNPPPVALFEEAA